MASVGVTILGRAPVEGRVKTRLAREVGDGPAARLHVALTLDVCARMAAWRPGGLDLAPADVVLALDGDELDWGALGGPLPVRREHQGEGDLGERIASALARRLAEGHERALVVGADCPLLDDGLLAGALAALDASDAVIVPATDGGFVLLGARVPLPDRALANVSWGSAEAREGACRALATAGISVALAGLGDDVDQIADLLRLGPALRRAGLAPRTVAWMARHLP